MKADSLIFINEKAFRFMPLISPRKLNKQLLWPTISFMSKIVIPEKYRHLNHEMLKIDEKRLLFIVFYHKTRRWPQAASAVTVKKMKNVNVTTQDKDLLLVNPKP